MLIIVAMAAIAVFILIIMEHASSKISDISNNWKKSISMTQDEIEKAKKAMKNSQ